MDFYRFGVRDTKEGVVLYPDFVVGRSHDLMVRGGAFYAVWDEAAGLWSTDEYDVQRLVDEELAVYAREQEEKTGIRYKIKWMRSLENNSWLNYRKLIKNTAENHIPLDTNLTFANDPVRKKDYASKRLPYAIEAGDYSAWDELVGTLYSVEERAKIEWAIGAVISGDAKKIQKFLVLYGSAGTGKSTILNIIERLFEGYTATFDAKALGTTSAQFATEAFKNNPLVAIQHDGDLSRIEDNTKLNSIVSHEWMTMNEKYRASYTAKVMALLFMGTNQPVKISDAKSGIIRRLIDVNPTGVTLGFNHYTTLMGRIDFELGAIAHHCLQVYRSMGKNAYDSYRPVEMMFQTDPFFNFVEYNYDVFKSGEGVSLKRAYLLYKEFCDNSGIKAFPQYKIREELRNYFDEFHERFVHEDGSETRSFYTGFNLHKFRKPAKDETSFSLVLEETVSLFDELAASYPAQLATEDGHPRKAWSSVKTTLSDLNTGELHFVRVPENHIVIDFDLKDENGEKSLERNLEAASLWPPTYAELSKSGKGVHLHYLYEGGDVSALRAEYAVGIEIKVFSGKSALRRQLSKANAVPIAGINGGFSLPKKEKKMIGAEQMMSEKGVRDLILRNLRKEFHPGTKPSIDFIKKVLDDAYESGMSYDVSDLRPRIIAFANNSSHQALICIKIVQQMKFQGTAAVEDAARAVEAADERIVFFDVEVYPNLFVVCWKFAGDANVVRMINPEPHEIEKLLKFKLVGFNCRRYDNHILWARFMGYTVEGLYKVSGKLINNEQSGTFGEAYSASYADIYDFSSLKQSLKKFQIDLGLHHKELDIPWDQPVPEERWQEVCDYCANDVVTTEQTFESRRQDFVARQILAEMSGLTVNDTTQKHTARILFGNDKNPQASFKYTDLSTKFPGYKYDLGKSKYKGEDPSEGGYVYAEPGMYTNVALLDVASMHPTSIQILNLFGPYTKRFTEIVQARLAIKHNDYELAKTMLGGKLQPYLGDEKDAAALAYALKIVVNIVYGLTSAKFDNPFRDLRNKDNIVAKHGALFMIDLKEFVQAQGFTVAHIKTDSIKIPNATPEIIEAVKEFGQKYGYTFEHEETYEKFCLVNDAVYAAKVDGKWTTVGAQFQHPFVYNALFQPMEDVSFEDLCETKQVTQGSMYLDFEAANTPMALAHGGMQFVGRTGRFVPVTESSGGAILWRIKDDKKYAVTGTKGYFWLEAEMFKKRQEQGDKVEIDMTYFEELVDDARKTIAKFGDLEEFIS